MTRRGVFIADGTSDLQLGRILHLLCLDEGLDLDITTLHPSLVRGRTLVERLATLKNIDHAVDVLFVHRDAEAQDPQRRYTEIADGAASAGFAVTVPVVPVRMTEAWLLLDEAAIRSVAGRPRGREPLGLPRPHEIERLADPKALLRATLLLAAGTTGRRRDNLMRDFPRRREQLLERLDRHGPVTRLSAWQRLVADIQAAVQQLLST